MADALPISPYFDPCLRFMLEYQKGEIIFEQDSEGDQLFVIISGAVAISKRRQGIFKQVALLEEGEIFGEMALVDRAPRTARATAAQNRTRLIVVNQPRFIYLVSQQPVFALTIMQVLCQRIHSIEEGYNRLLREERSRR
ncbi:MAG: cyclic nucleotide-binding domain-containing protein [Deltaproteobacteria bacterium]|nr:cyclic nucleotide-binding domain-containing protein [Deltaproteobacteria bacterium]